MPSDWTGAAVNRRVLHAVEQFGAASQTFLADRIAALDALGWPAWVATHHVDPIGAWSVPPPARVCVSRATGWRRALRAARVPVSAHPSPSGWIEQAVEPAGPALLHAHFGWVGVQALPVARRHGLPLVVGFHGFDATVWPHYGHRRRRSRTDPRSRYRDLFAEAAAVLATSHWIEQRLRELGCEREVDVIPSGTALERFPFRGPRAGATNALQLLFVGRLVPYKGLDVLLAALPHVLAELPGTRLTVIGDGPRRRDWTGQAKALGVEAAVDFRGALPRSGVEAALARADVLVLPSRTVATGQAEALGNVTKEALAVGLEVVATANGGIPETLPPGRRAELVPEGDAAALAARILAVAADRRPWAERAAEGRRWVEDTFDWQRLAPRLAGVYERVMAPGGAPRPLPAPAP